MVMIQVLFISAIILHFFFICASASVNPSNPKSYPRVQLYEDKTRIVLANGLIRLTLSNPEGLILAIKYNGIDNLLEYGKARDRGYWDIVSNGQDQLDGTRYEIIHKDNDRVEIAFISKWDSSAGINRPLNVDKRFILLRGSSGFYTYAIFERPKGWPGLPVDQARVCFKLNHKLFSYMAISDTRQRFMPSSWDRGTGKSLAYKEAVLMENPSNKFFAGEVDDKYQYSADIHDNRLNGWISFSKSVGFWVITPSNEFRIGGPFKQELTSHVGPTSMAVFFSSHYAGSVSPVFEDGEPWKKVFGPVFIYLNTASPKEDPRTLWQDAKRQMVQETESWPYNFPLSEDYPKAQQRGTVRGRLLVRDRYLSKYLINGNSAYVGLANPGEARSWQFENKGYQFWTNADAEGNFVIKNIRAGNYNLFAWVPGVIGDYRYEVNVNVTEGSEIKLGDIVYDPPRTGPTLWEIGVPDRTAAEFYIPDPLPGLENRLYIKKPEERFRQYGLWDRYSDLYPKDELTYTVGTSDYRKDWFYAHVTRKQNNTHVPTTWRVFFDLKDVEAGSYTLQVALASSNYAELKVSMNDQLERPIFTTGRVGKDNAIARHGIHGLYWLYSINIDSHLLVKGLNTLYLRQSRGQSPFAGFMYDYIRLEGPPQQTH